MVRTLHLGLHPPPLTVHYPVIRIVPSVDSAALNSFLTQLPEHSHLLFTSQVAAKLLFHHSPSHLPPHLIAIGHATAQTLTALGHPPHHIATDATSEGVIALLDQLSPTGLAWPHSARSRPVISHYCQQKGLPLLACSLYTTVNQQPGPPPDLNAFDAITFTSPSTVDGFFAIWTEIPNHLTINIIGSITQKYLDQRQRRL
ncbi:MAG: uroporphyrinogen-III synthase [Chlamydiia bacterium]|nr:uroporphyrinogen-III synthase [Chlamydiia bacterium]